ncbi:hypothetical protein [Acinetobacter rudis]|uniref:Filamentous hemagglutinin n=1 Tax=Acinetobacter rudis TaxID=632955 RepID=A0AAW8J9Y8_9GAMM|nr:hypothetical protein [Acinetobacter rudis]MDQ8936413.1 hypothetical protein [Acinetobacter rudis]MDQ9018636.1 hypothetical protein [Acinetobacter rudis]
MASAAGAVVVTAAEETAIATTSAAILCTKTPAYFRAVGAVIAAVGLEILSEEDRKKAAATPAPKPLPSTSGNSTTGGPSNGGGDNEKWNEKNFTVDKAQLGKKLGMHVSDFGRNPANVADRQYVQNIIENIGKNPDKIVRGSFVGQGPGGTRGVVQFRIKGNDVVVTKPDGTFVTILRNGIKNPLVKQAISGVSK